MTEWPIQKKGECIKFLLVRSHSLAEKTRQVCEKAYFGFNNNQVRCHDVSKQAYWFRNGICDGCGDNIILMQLKPIERGVGKIINEAKTKFPNGK